MCGGGGGGGAGSEPPLDPPLNEMVHLSTKTYVQNDR